MAHYAILDENGIVVDVIVGIDESGLRDWESIYSIQYDAPVKRTSYNTFGGVHKEGGTPYRKNYAMVGHTYDPDRDAFIPPKPYESWVLNEDTCLWEAPSPKPNDGEGFSYMWNDDTESWEKMDLDLDLG